MRNSRKGAIPCRERIRVDLVDVRLSWLFKLWIGLPLLVSNALAVAAMALLNFALAAAWVFRGVEARSEEPGLSR